jgi:hypothetical protein
MVLKVIVKLFLLPRRPLSSLRNFMLIAPRGMMLSNIFPLLLHTQHRYDRRLIFIFFQV